MKILFITWDGPETNYLENLFVPIFERLQKEHGYDFHIIQFTWGDEQRIEKTKVVCCDADILYTMIPVYRKIALLGVLKAIFWQSRQVVQYVKQHEIDAVMPRATTAAAIVNNMIKKTNAKYVFDADGFSQDERVDFSGWNPNGAKYKMYRSFEHKALHLAQAVLARSHKAKNILAERAGNAFNKEKITVISNGKDSTIFNVGKEGSRDGDGINFVYAGSLGPQYMFSEMIEIFIAVVSIKSESKFTILTGNETFIKSAVAELSKSIQSKITAMRVAPSDVVGYLQKADIGFALRKPTFSMQGVAPIKLSEYLLCGLPVITNAGIGDTEQILEGKEAAFLVTNLNETEKEKLVAWCLETKGNRTRNQEARNIGLEHFTLDTTIERYHSALKNL